MCYLIIQKQQHLQLVGAVLTDLFKALDCIPHDLLIAKLSSYGLNSDSLCYIYSYLKDRKQCVQINNEQSEFDTIISGVPQGSIFGPILYNIFFNDFFFFIPKASVHNFADDNTLASFASTLKELLPILESECEAAINWLHNNKMIVNPDKFQVILLDKRGSDNTNIELKIGNEKIKSTSSVKLLGVHIDDKLNFNHHINKLCKSAGNQLNALTRLKSFLGLKERVVLVNSFIYSNFDYCPLVWMFSHKKSLNKIESLHKRALRFLLNDYENSYEELLEKSGKCNMSLQRIRFLCIEIYKSINSLNPDFMKNIFEMKTNNRIVREKYKLNLNIPRTNQVKFGTNSLKSYGPKIWNALPFSIKTAENLKAFKTLIKKWNGASCNCIICSQ